MARPATILDKSLNDSDSDYGLDPFSPDVVETLIFPGEDDNPIVNKIEHHDPQRTLRLPHVFGREERSPIFKAAQAAERVSDQISQSIKIPQYPQLANQIETPDTVNGSEEPLPAEPKSPDTRSPLERFRKQPKKALSVTDLVSPAWCELQYWYTLILHGRKKRTPAMKQGSVVHKKLEDQVHTTVKVEIETKEDAWGLRVWNVIQGLRTLRGTGLTRELEIWGTVDGLVVNGVIDQLSYICPDAELEESLLTPPSQKPSQKEPPPDQATISEFFKSTGATSMSEAARTKRRTCTKKVYLCDVKTRSARSLPSGAAFRPTKMQLMLYHRLLSALATDTIDLSILTTRYDLDSSKVFSDVFIAQVGSLNDEVFYDALSVAGPSQGSHQSWNHDSMTTLLAHNTLSALWSLMIAEFQRTLPDGAASLGNILKAEYRSRDTGEIVGSKTITMDEKELTAYIGREMEWWKGEREAEGVVVEEAFKCRSCEFADSCEWRLKKVEEVKEKVRMTRKRSTAV